MRTAAHLTIVALAAGVPGTVAGCFPGFAVGEAPGADAAADGPTDSSVDTGDAAPEAARDGVATTDSAADMGTVLPDGDAGVAVYVGPIGPSNNAIAAASAPDTRVGDLILICVYVEPANEQTDAATYGPFPAPTGFTLAAWEPIASNDANLTSQKTNRQYVWWGYATAGGVQNYGVVADGGAFYYADTAIVTIRGFATSGNPFADPPATATYGDGTNVNDFPSVSLTPAGDGTGLLWLGTSWTMGDFGYPSNYQNLLDYNTLSIAWRVQQTAAQETVAPAVQPMPINLMTAALMSFR